MSSKSSASANAIPASHSTEQLVGVFNLSPATNMRLAQLWASVQAAQRVVNSAVYAAQREADRYNDAIGNARELLGIPPEAAAKCDFNAATLTVED